MKKPEAPTIVNTLARVGIRLALRGGRIKAEGNTSALTPQMLTEVRNQIVEVTEWMAWDWTPLAADWARYFRGFPDELERLGASARDCPPTPPAGKNTTPIDWARWFVAHPSEMDLASDLTEADRRRQELTTHEGRRFFIL